MALAQDKVDIYAASGAFAPDELMAVFLDVGTNNKAALEDEIYLGLR